MQPLRAFNYWDIVFPFNRNGLMFKVTVQYQSVLHRLCTSCHIWQTALPRTAHFCSVVFLNMISAVQFWGWLLVHTSACNPTPAPVVNEYLVQNHWKSHDCTIYHWAFCVTVVYLNSIHKTLQD